MATRFGVSIRPTRRVSSPDHSNYVRIASSACLRLGCRGLGCFFFGAATNCVLLFEFGNILRRLLTEVEANGTNYAGSADAAVTGRVLREILLVVVLCIIERVEWRYFRRDLSVTRGL